MYIWQVAPKINQDFKKRFPEINPIILQLLWNRKLNNQEKIDEFLLPDYSQDLHDPFLFKDMAGAVERIKQAIEKKEKITIYGDYDADGVSSTAILYLTLEKMGAEVFYYLPDREKEGYGMKKDAIKEIAKQGTKLIITVDCGVTNVEEVEVAKNFGLDVIVTDHHLPLKVLPRPLFIINPWLEKEKYPFKELAGAGVAFKVAQALLKRYPVENAEAFEKWLLDLVALGSVADIVSLKGENRVLVKYGLIVLNKTSRSGLRYLIKKTRINLGQIDTRAIGLQIASRVNAAGRVDHANIALEMILATDKKKSKELADRLNKLNELRQKKMEKIFEEAKKIIGDSPTDKIILAAKENWPIGILGTTSHRLMDIYHRPTILISIRDNQIRGCGRSLEGINLIEILKKLENFLDHYGGHSGAAGFTLKNKTKEGINQFYQKLQVIAEREMTKIDFEPKIWIDLEVKLKDLNWNLLEEVKRFEPFGEDNPPPVFLAKDLRLKEVKNVGKKDKHLKITIDDGRKMIYFGGGKKLEKKDINKKIDVVFELGENHWNGIKEMEFRVLDLKKYESS